MHDALPHPDDFHLAQECLEGRTSALRHLQETYRKPLLAFLQSRGALPSEAADIVEELWSDCVAPRDGELPKLARYNGMCTLQTFLNAITLNILVTMKRKEKRRERLMSGVNIGGTTGGAAGLGVSGGTESVEAPLLDLMRDAIQAAFLACPAEDFVLLQLTHTDGLHAVELAKIFNSTKSTVNRDVHRVGREIAEATMQYVKATDPWLELKWEDFLDLCRSASPACFGVE